MSHDLNKIYVTFSSPILDMIIVCFICFDKSLFAGLIFWLLYGYIPMSKRFFSPMKKSQFQVGQNFEEKIIVLSSKLCLKLFVYFSTDYWHLGRATTM